jgi:outer membrane protein assembly factor BamE (lipoprotein component of BamABCDE complex)
VRFSFLYIFLIFLSSACVSRVERHGFVFDFSDHEMLQEGITGKERVLKMMGSPSFVSDLDYDEAWIYYSQELKHFLFFKPKTVSREILVVRFDEKNLVKNLQKISLSDEERNLSFSTKQTTVEGHQVGLIKSFFSNVGQIKPQ